MYAYVLDVDNVLNLGLAVHLADHTTRDGRLARELLDEVHTFKPQAEKDKAYLFSVRCMSLTLGNRLNYISRDFEAALQAAEEYKQNALDRVKETQTQDFWINLIARILMYGGLGFTIMAALIPSLHIKHEQTQEFAITLNLVGAVIFAAGSRVWKSKVITWQDAKIHKHYDELRQAAKRQLLRTKLSALETTRNRMVHLWREYADEEPPELYSLVADVAEELKLHESEARKHKEMNVTLLNQMLERIKRWRRRNNHKEHSHA